MITTFSGSNYKAFEEFNLELKPLTILLGANSCGKSALINSLLMLSQSSDRSIISESALRLNGPKVGMGDSINIIKDKNPTTTIDFAFSFGVDTVLKKEIISLRRDFHELYFTVSRFINHFYRRNIDTSSTYTKLIDELDKAYIDDDNLFGTKKLSSFAKKIISLLKHVRKSLKETPAPARKISMEYIEFVEKTSLKKIEDGLIHLASIPVTKLSAHKVSFSFILNKKSKDLEISKYVQHCKSGEVFIKLERINGKVSLTSDVISSSALKRSKNEILSHINFSSMTLTNGNSRPPMRGGWDFLDISPNPFVSLFVKTLKATTNYLSSCLSDLKINHVSPLRAFPQRYYLLDKSIHHRQLNALDGTELAEVLKKNPVIRENINRLLAPFNIAVDVDKVNDIIHKISVTQDAVKLELTDVGFGISQVLPILVQAYLSPEDSLTIIEQPEIHLHPNMQAWLTDALIFIALKEKKRFLIETHSDALIRRIRLRIVDEKSELTENDVRIYHLERNKSESCTKINQIPISDDGDIIWPTGFMDVEIQDTLNIQKLKIEKSYKKKDVY